ncbi:efflux RND transporter permease subunit [Gimesia panareensis]|uniref:Nickel and cobalt resistance protein CnrA n=1 Tax=Gimesia panareensis TaxID=2527978 RepID=A0A518AED4_9PLAN|nr:efflux RND transporter permease subunit [Gimesia panareensis]QDT30006.1 Nickel and cobalt resistance protein CnrA [Gimesia panareensis]QDU53088.1 Nickel and cobalt resistance protein CnrA [Gimesia panareensis]
MLNSIIRLSLTHRTLVLAACVVILAYGGYLTTTLPIDVFPDLDRPRVVILTQCPGMSSEEVETLVTYPIETAILGANGVEDVRSQSSQGMNVIYIEFSWKTEPRYARQIVSERLATVPMPPGIRPIMTPQASIMGQILHVGIHRRTGPQGGTIVPVGQTGLLAERIEKEGKPYLTVWNPVERNDLDKWQKVPVQNPEWDPHNPGRMVTFNWNQRSYDVVFPTPLEERMDLRTTADWLIRPRLLKLNGIAEVIVMGGDKKQYQVLVDPIKLQEYNVSLQDVEAAVQSNNLNASGGFILSGQTERPVRIIGRLGALTNDVLEELRRAPVKMNGDRAVLLENVAEIVEGPAPKRGDASIDGHAGVVITIVKQPHADTRKLTDNVMAALHDAETSLPADIVINTKLFKLKNFIDRGIYYVEEALVIGAVLVVIVLFLFLLNLRTTFITLTAIPLSLVITTLVFRVVGVITGTELSINVMTLGGIAVAIGELVDDAIVDVENIFRRLGENNLSPDPKPAIVVVYEASREIRSAIIFGTAVVVLAFMPLFALSGVEGRLFVPLGVAYIVSILASLLVSLTVTPVLSYYLLPQAKATHEHQDGRLLRFLKWGAGFLIRFSMRHAAALLLLTWTLVGVSVWELSRLGADFLPKFDEGSVQINVTLPGGSSLKASNEASSLIDAQLVKMQKSKANPNGPILHFFRRTGRAERDEHAQPVNVGEYILTMNPEANYDRDEFLETLLSDLETNVPGVGIEAEQPLSHLISHMLSGVKAQVGIKIYGDDLDKLRELAGNVRDAITDIPGVTPPIIDPQERVDELHVVLKPEELAYFGLSREYVANFVRTALKGEAVSQVLEGQRRFDLVIKLDEPYRSDPYNLGALRLELPDGRGQIRLRELADFPGSASGPNLVNRENVRRRQTIRCNVSGRDLASTVEEIEKQVREQVELPTGYFVEFGGQFEAQRSATLLITILAAVSIAGIFIVLMMLYPSARITFQILNAIPTAFIGGVFALVLTKQTLTVASMVGFVSLGGIAVRNGILLVTHYFHLMEEEGEAFSPQMVLRGSLERLAPVLMTALTAGIALIPLVVGGNKPGLEILYPVATVILGGLVTSTFCEFFIHPGLFWKFSGKDADRLVRSETSDEELLRAATQQHI